MHSADVALFILRAVLGGTIALHGLNKFRGGLRGVGSWFESMGMRPGRLHATLAASSETFGGIGLAVGLLTPFAGLALASTMTVAGVVGHRNNGFFIFRPGQGWEYTMVLAFCTAAAGALPAGKLALDHAFGFDPSGWWPFVLCFAGAPLAAASMLAAFFRPPADS